MVQHQQRSATQPKESEFLGADVEAPAQRTLERTAGSIRIGERVQVRAYKSDGLCCRWWYATVEAVERDKIVLVTPVGHRVHDIGGAWASECAIRAFYWFERCYSLLEVYAYDGRLDEIYVNITSPVEIEGSQMRFTDYELDVARKPPHEARLVDEEEFLEAASRYAYSKEFQRACYDAGREAIELADRWAAQGMPTIPLKDIHGR